MRILYVISSLAACGPVNVLYDIVRPLLPHDEVMIATLKEEPESGSRADEFAEAGARVTCLTNTRLASAFHGRRNLRWLISQFRPHVVHAHGYRADLLCRGLGQPVITTVHNNIYEDFRDTYGPILGRAMELSQVRALRAMNCVVACSQSNADYLVTRYGLPVVAIRNGIDGERFTKASAQAKADLRSELGTQPNSYVLISTGGCSERKRTLALIGAFERVFEDNPEFELYILGGGPQLEVCQQRAGANVHVLGASSRVVDYLQASDLFISTSASEGMPLAVLEALATGLPAILSNIGPHEEISELVGDPLACETTEISGEGLDRTLGKLLSDRTNRHSAADVSPFLAELMSSQYRSLYQRIIGG